jgi:3-oxoacyl-[acyl-carrier protein] reductase
MTDMLLEIAKNPTARKMVGGMKLPVPLPEDLRRLRGPMVERFLEGRNVLVGGASSADALTQALAGTLARAGAGISLANLANAGLDSGFAEAGEAYGRVAHPAQDDGKYDALVLDATGLESAADLGTLHEFFHPHMRRIARSGRIVILGRPADSAKSVRAAAACSALEGFNRSLAKEVGGKGATSNLVVVEDGAEDRLSSVLRFFLSPASAFVTAQPLRVSANATWNGEDPWVQPLDGKVALVTGAARGIGAATAALLANEGAHVVCLDRPEDDGPLGQTARAVRGSVLTADVSDTDTPERIANHLREQHGGVDIVIHNAGVTRDRMLANMDRGRWDQTLGINLEAVINITEALIEDGTLRDDGRIVSLASISGIAGNAGQTNYSASKAGVIGFTRSLAKQVAARGITVNAVAPGFIETRMTASVPAVVRQAGRRLAALGQGGLPEDVGRALTFLSLPGSAGVTGNILRICGGALLGA